MESVVAQAEATHVNAPSKLKVMCTYVHVLQVAMFTNYLKTAMTMKPLLNDNIQ